MSIVEITNNRFVETGKLNDEVYVKAIKIGLATLLDDTATPTSIKAQIEECLVPKPKGEYKRKGYY